MKIIDISVPISADLPTYPGDAVLEVIPVEQISRGDDYNLSRIIMSSHCGTHVDPPRHFIEGAAGVDQLRLELLVGEALVVEFPGVKEVGRRELEQVPLEGVRRLLIKTGNARLWRDPEFSPDFASLSQDGAEFLVEKGVRLVGIEYLSIEKYNGSGEVHRLLLEHGVIVIEGLNMEEAHPGRYDLVCLPLRLKDGDGAPARAVLIARGETAFDPHTTRWPLS